MSISTEEIERLVIEHAEATWQDITHDCHGDAVALRHIVLGVCAELVKFIIPLDQLKNEVVRTILKEGISPLTFASLIENLDKETP